MANPLLNPAVLLSPVQDGYVAYDPSLDRLHRLNPIAALIAELSDGTRSESEIAALVAPLLAAGAEGEVARWLRTATEAGFIVLGNETVESAREMSPQELAKLAERLRSHGKVQTAFLCRRRVAELLPEDAQAWCDYGDIAHVAGRREDARAAYEHYLALVPDDAEIRHILHALKDGNPPPRVPDECIRQLYQRFSAFYDANMCEELGYEGPERIDEMLRAELGETSGLAVLDLGCGSGLAGMRLRRRACTLHGIDLSSEMVELARARKNYDRLEVAEITAWLARAAADGGRYDLVVACDTMIYFGDIAPVAKGVAAILNPGGLFVFTVERGERAPFRLTDSGRYAHHPDHLAKVAAQSMMSLSRVSEGFLRTEYGVDVTGLCAAFTKPA